MLIGNASSNGCLYVRFGANSFPSEQSGTIIAAKLELGYLSTLARKDESGNWVLNDPAPNFQQELAKCQRYLCVLKGFSWIGSGNIDVGNVGGQFFLPTPVPMRALPTFSGTMRIYNGVNNLEVSSIAIGGFGTNGVNGSFTVSGWDASDGTSLSCWLNSGEKMYLTSDL